MTHKLAIVGSRGFSEEKGRKHIELYINLLKPTLIISGGAKGPDTWAVQIATDMGIETLILLARWQKLGKIAGLVRNTEIVGKCDSVLALWDGNSRGTLDTITKAAKAGKGIVIVGR